MKKGINDNVILVLGASGVGKSSVCEYMADLYLLGDSFAKKKVAKYKHIDLDNYFSRYKKMKVSDYFNKVGYKKFWQESYKYIWLLYKRHTARKSVDSETILLIDVGAGSTLDYKSSILTEIFCSVLLTADPEYLFEREKCKNNHKELGYFKWIEFSKEREELYKNCTIKVDISYLSVDEVAQVVDKKINNYKFFKK